MIYPKKPTFGPAFKKSILRHDDYWIWCTSPVIDDEGKCHLFASRISKSKNLHPGWLFSSEIIRAEGPSPEGPFEFKKVVFGPRDPNYFDGRTAHNPCIRKVGGKYYLFYMGSTYGGEEVDSDAIEAGGDFYMSVWSNKRAALAVSESPEGPWTRPSKPILEPRPGKWDSIATTNPAPAIHSDGSVTLMYKSRTKIDGPRQLGIAKSDFVGGPYKAVLEEALFKSMDVEDPCLWISGDWICAILKDMSGDIGGEEGGLIFAYSKDGLQWELPDNCLVHGKTIRWDDGTEETLGNFERPQILLNEEGFPTHLFAAITKGGSGIGDAKESMSVCLPILK